MSSKLTATDPLDKLSSFIVSLPLMVAMIIPFVPGLWWLYTAWIYQVCIGALFVVSLFRLRTEHGLDTLRLLVCSPIFIGATIHLLTAFATMGLGPKNIMMDRLITLVWCSYLPIVVCVFAFKKPSDFLPAFYAILLAGLYWSFFDLAHAVSNGFQPLYAAAIDGVHKNRLGQMSVVGGLIAMSYLMTQRPTWWQSIILVAAVFATALSCLAVDARACLLSIPIGAFLIGVTRINKKKASWKDLAAVVVCSVVLVFGALKAAPHEKLERLSNTEEGSSFAARPLYWDLSIKYIQAHPFQPVGFRNQAEGDRKTIDNPCNFFLQQWLEVGLLGSLSYTVVLVASLITNFRICSRPTRSKDLAMVAACCLSIQCMRFIFEGQDLMSLGIPQGMLLYFTIGITVFMDIGIKLNERAARQAGLT